MKLSKQITAGIASHKPAIDLAPGEWQMVIDANLNGVFFVAQAAAWQFIAQSNKGAIVTTASMSDTIGNIFQQQTGYNASKAAVIHLTKSMAVEWAEYGIRGLTASVSATSAPI